MYRRGSSSTTPKQIDSIRININIVGRSRQHGPLIPQHHVRHADRVQILQVEVRTLGTVILHDALLAHGRVAPPTARRRTRRAVVVEETVQARAVHEHVVCVEEAEAVGHRARGGGAGGAVIREAWVGEGGVEREARGRLRMRLVVWGFGLDLSHEDVGRVGELVLVQGVVFDGGADEPDGAGGALDEEAPPRVDCQLGVGRVVDVVVRGPQPAVFDIEAGGADGDVHRHVGADAGGVDGAGGWRGWALGFFKIGAREAADARVHVPHARGGRRGGCEVPLDEDGAGLGPLGGNDHVAPFDDACVAGVADLHDDLGCVDVGEEAPARHDDRVALPHDLGAFRDQEGFGHFVGPRVDEDDSAGARGRVDHVLQGGRVVCDSVPFGAAGSDTRERRRRQRVVLRLGPFVEFASGDERGRSGRRRPRPLRRRRSRGTVHVARFPASNGRGPCGAG